MKDSDIKLSHFPEPTVVAEETSDERALLAEVASAYFANPSNRVAPHEIELVMEALRKGLGMVAVPGRDRTVTSTVTAAAPDGPKPAVPIEKSVTDDLIYSLEDGIGRKALKRHLKSRDLTPEEYRKKWNLPPDYPMTSKSYSEKRSALARSMKLGAKPRT